MECALKLFYRVDAVVVPLVCQTEVIVVSGVRGEALILPYAGPSKNTGEIEEVESARCSGVRLL